MGFPSRSEAADELGPICAESCSVLLTCKLLEVFDKSVGWKEYRWVVKVAVSAIQNSFLIFLRLSRLL